MDKLVKRLLELMKLEYEDRKFNDTKFDIVELINEVIRNSQVMLKEHKIEVEFKVIADLQPKVGKVVVKNIISYDKVTQADVDGIVNKIFNYGTFGKYVKNKYDEAQAEIPSEPSYDVNYEDDLLDSGDNELDLNNPTIEIG